METLGESFLQSVRCLRELFLQCFYVLRNFLEFFARYLARCRQFAGMNVSLFVRFAERFADFLGNYSKSVFLGHEFSPECLHMLSQSFGRRDKEFQKWAGTRQWWDVAVGSAKPDLFGLAGMRGPLFFLFFSFFIGGRIAFEPLRQFVVRFFPFLVWQSDFMNQVQSPREIS
jgi:hypothetical protein